MPEGESEWGVSVLDLIAAKQTPPDLSGRNWHKFIPCRHFRNRRSLPYRETRILVECPEYFQHGRSDTYNFIRIDRVFERLFTEIARGTLAPPAPIGACFRPPRLPIRETAAQKRLDDNKVLCYDHNWNLQPNFDKPPGPAPSTEMCTGLPGGKDKRFGGVANVPLIDDTAEPFDQDELLFVGVALSQTQINRETVAKLQEEPEVEFGNLSNQTPPTPHEYTRHVNGSLNGQHPTSASTLVR